MLIKGTRVQTALNIEHESISQDCAAAISGRTGIVEDERHRAYESLRDSFVLVRFDTPIRHWSDTSPNIVVESFWVPRRFIGEYDHGKWQQVSFMSGTVIVQRCDGIHAPWLYVYYAADLAKNGITEDDSERMRSKYADDLAAFLSGGQRPAWMDTYKRAGDTWVKNHLGGTISACPHDYPDKSALVRLIDRLGCKTPNSFLTSSVVSTDTTSVKESDKP